MTESWPIPPNTPEAAAAIERVRRMLRGERIGPGPNPPLPRKPTPIKVSNKCGYTRGGRRCNRFGSMTNGEYRCDTHAYLP